MKITIIAHADTIEAAGLLNVNAKRRRRFKKDNSPAAVAQRRKAKLYRQRNKSRLEQKRKQYLQKNKTRLAKRAAFLEKAPKGPVLQRSQAASMPKVKGANPACLKVIDSLAKVCKVPAAQIKADIFGDDGYTIPEDCSGIDAFLKTMKMKREEDDAVAAKIGAGWTLRGRKDYHDDGLFTLWLDKDDAAFAAQAADALYSKKYVAKVAKAAEAAKLRVEKIDDAVVIFFPAFESKREGTTVTPVLDCAVGRGWMCDYEIDGESNGYMYNSVDLRAIFKKMSQMYKQLGGDFRKAESFLKSVVGVAQASTATASSIATGRFVFRNK